MQTGIGNRESETGPIAGCLIPIAFLLDLKVSQILRPRSAPSGLRNAGAQDDG
jgi:hypothetical protein